MTLVFRISGTKPAPMPAILCGPGSQPDSTALAAGSTATQRKPGLRFLMTSPTPVIVPPVPMPEMRMSQAPSVSFQISSAVVRRWISGFAGLVNWPTSRKRFGSLATISAARAIAPFMPLAPSVSTSSAPKACSMRRRSMLIVSGMVSTSR